MSSTALLACLLTTATAAPFTVSTATDRASPALAVDAGGTLAVAFVATTDGDEAVWLRTGAPGALGPPVAVTTGARAWHPRLAATGSEVWLAWCARAERGPRGTYAREIFVRRVLPWLGEIVPVSHDGPAHERACEPDLALAGDGTLHVVWEQAGPDGVRVAYRALAPGGRPLGPSELVSSGPFDRRPAVATLGANVHVGWDRWADAAPTGATDPDYDVWLRSRDERGWSAARAIDARGGIQAAPALAATTGGVLVAYHSSERYGLVKLWQLRRVTATAIETLAYDDPEWAREPRGEQQGSELPALASAPNGAVALVTRPSQGAYLHVAHARGLEPTVDLERHGWGARGMRAAVAFAPDGRLWIARRARAEVTLESFALTATGAPPFVPAHDPAKPQLARIARGARPAPVPGLTVLYGDVHMHSAASDGTGPPDEVYARAWVRGLDFATLTDHDWVAGSRLPASLHEELCWLTDYFHQRDGFLTLHAWEWTTPPVPAGAGHRNVYFRERPPSPPYGYKDGYATTELLFKALLGERAFAAPHHTGWTGTDWEKHDGRVQRHLEIVSTHGAFEHAGNLPIAPRGELAGMFAVDGLARGLELGFLGGSDAHGLLYHHGIGRNRDPWTAGRTGVAVRALTREGLFDALYERRTFATSGPPMLVWLAAGELLLGESGRGRPELRWVVRGTAPLARVLLLRDGHELASLPLTGATSEGVYTDTDALPGPHYYYLRAVQGADVGWSSPLFLKP